MEVGQNCCTAFSFAAMAAVPSTFQRHVSMAIDFALVVPQRSPRWQVQSSHSPLPATYFNVFTFTGGRSTTIRSCPRIACSVRQHLVQSSPPFSSCASRTSITRSMFPRHRTQRSGGRHQLIDWLEHPGKLGGQPLDTDALRRQQYVRWDSPPVVGRRARTSNSTARPISTGFLRLSATSRCPSTRSGSSPGANWRRLTAVRPQP